MRLAILLFICAASYCPGLHAQPSRLIFKGDLTRLANPFNSTIQIGAEYYLNERLSLQADLGIASHLFNQEWYNSGLFVSHTQVRKYGHSYGFWGIDLFYMHAKKYSPSRVLYDKQSKIHWQYDSVMLVKNSVGLACVTGAKYPMGRFTIENYFGLGIRLVNNKPEGKKAAVPPGFFAEGHYQWHNDRYSGTFLGGHVLAGIKLGYVLRY